MPPGEAATPTQRIVHTVMYKQKLSQYNNAQKLHENYIDELSTKQTAELEQLIITVDAIVNKCKSKHTSKLSKFRHAAYYEPQITPFTYLNFPT